MLPKPFHLMSIEEIAEEARSRDARRKKGMPVTATPAELKREHEQRDERLEREVQRDVVKEYRARGCTVYITSVKKQAKVTPGVADLLVFHRRTGRFWFHETKNADGSQLPSQQVFEEDCIETGMTYILGGVGAALAQIERLGLTL